MLRFFKNESKSKIDNSELDNRVKQMMAEREKQDAEARAKYAVQLSSQRTTAEMPMGSKVGRLARQPQIRRTY